MINLILLFSQTILRCIDDKVEVHITHSILQDMLTKTTFEKSGNNDPHSDQSRSNMHIILT